MNSVDEQVHRLAKVRDEQLAGQASGAGARALLASIITETEPAFDERIPVARRRFRLPRLQVGALVVATAAAGLAAAVIIIPGTAPAGTSPGRRPAISASETTGHLAARNFLLAAAESAARKPDTRGRYWYVRTLEYGDHLADKNPNNDIEKYRDLLQKWYTEFSMKADGLALAGKTEEIKALAQEYRQKDQRYRRDYGQKNRPLYSVTISAFSEWWAARDKREAVLWRWVTGIEPKAIFASPADEQKWKDLGSPDLGLPKRPKISDGKNDKAYEDENTKLGLGICDNLDRCGKLPTSKEEMEKWLRSDYAKGFGSIKQWGVTTSYAEYLGGMAGNLTGSPVSPGTRAALLEVLADQPGITSLGKATDPLGRTGVVLGLPYTSTFPMFEAFGLDLEMRFFFEEGSKKLLAIDEGIVPQSRKSVSAVEDWSKWEIIASSGWVDKLGERPQG